MCFSFKTCTHFFGGSCHTKSAVQTLKNLVLISNSIRQR